MPNEVPWTQRTFAFDFPAGLRHELLERLRGTPARVEELTRSLTPDVLTERDGEKWSIQENIAHLADLESLFTGRLDDFLANAKTLRPADMTNKTTHEANHNERHIEDVLGDFRARRGDLVRRLEALADDDFERTSQHPRLGTPMRVVDMMLFHAEHDDYHLARARSLLRALESPPI
jgi:uncharacterized damage-inducible protein DinB